jgi:hypothetical protein
VQLTRKKERRERPEFARRTPIRVFLPPALNAEYLALRASHETEQQRKENEPISRGGGGVEIEEQQGRFGQSTSTEMPRHRKKNGGSRAGMNRGGEKD